LHTGLVRAEKEHALDLRRLKGVMTGLEPVGLVDGEEGGRGQAADGVRTDLLESVRVAVEHEGRQAVVGSDRDGERADFVEDATPFFFAPEAA